MDLAIEEEDIAGFRQHWHGLHIGGKRHGNIGETLADIGISGT